MPPGMAPVAPLFHPLPSYADAAGSSLHQHGGTPHPMAGASISPGDERSSRSLARHSNPKVKPCGRPDRTASQADSAGSVPVTRSECEGPSVVPTRQP